MKTYQRKISINFQDDRIPKKVSHCIFLSVILIDSAFKIEINTLFGNKR